jgi:tetratricopeptide (TPR) repeat protein
MKNDSTPRGLSTLAIHAMREAVDALHRGALPQAERAIIAAMAHAPTHPEPRRMLGLVLQQTQRPIEALAAFREALALAPRDIETLIPMAKAQADTNDLPGAISTLRTVVAQRSDAKTLYVLARLLEQHGELDEALQILRHIVQIEPAHAQARLQVARNAFYCGAFDEAIAQFRKLIDDGKELASAWYGLAEMKTFKFDACDLAAIKTLAANPRFAGLERATLLHALGKAFEDNEDFASAYATFCDAAKLERSIVPWDAHAFANQMNSIRQAFPNSVVSQLTERGHEVIFILGMPRSGSTLIEQILAAHSQVEGGSELPDLNRVLHEESSRRRMPFPQWVNQTSDDDWRRLGDTYLERTRRWREKKSRFTDKSPGNWMMAEAIIAILPGAKIIDCRRDAVETCWSCFKQFFAPGRAAWSCSFDDLAAYWRACTKHCDYLATRYPERIRIQSYEKLIGDPDGQTQELLKFCGLEFDPRCLRFHDARRTIRTASAAQVRQPIKRAMSSSDRYGALLDPLRTALNNSD